MELRIPENVRLAEMVFILCRKYQVKVLTIAPVEAGGPLWSVNG